MSGIGSSQRVVGLDGVRAIAITLVVVNHATGHFEGGGVGVATFFVLSGYLITGLLVKEHDRSGSIHLGLFYARRALRLWPALIVMLAVTVALGGSPRSALIAVTYTTDLVNVFGTAAVPYGHTWSLGVEEQFYLLWPLVLLLAVPNARRAAFALIVLTAASVVGAWLWTLHSLHTTGAIGLGIFNPLWQGHGLLIGCILALVGNRWHFRWPQVTTVCASASIVAIATLATITVDRHWAVWWNLATELATLGLIVAVRDVTRGPLTWAPVVWLGKRSYALYLWHLPLIILAARHHIRGGAWLAVAAALIAAEISARFVEEPFLRLKDRLHPATEDHAPRHLVAPG